MLSAVSAESESALALQLLARCYNPETRQAHVLAKGFYYANGVALGPGGDYLLMVETNRIRVHRHWLKGPKVR